MRTIGWSGLNALFMSVTRTACVRLRAFLLVRPGTWVTMLTPGLKPSLRLSSVGSTGTPFLFSGIETRFRFTCLPVPVLGSVTVKWLLGHGNRQLVPGAAIVSQREALSSFAHCGTVRLRETIPRASVAPLDESKAVTISWVAPQPANTSRPLPLSGRSRLFAPGFRPTVVGTVSSGPLPNPAVESSTR